MILLVLVESGLVVYVVAGVADCVVGSLADVVCILPHPRHRLHSLPRKTSLVFVVLVLNCIVMSDFAPDVVLDLVENFVSCLVCC